MLALFSLSTYGILLVGRSDDSIYFLLNSSNKVLVSLGIIFGIFYTGKLNILNFLGIAIVVILPFFNASFSHFLVLLLLIIILLLNSGSLDSYTFFTICNSK